MGFVAQFFANSISGGPDPRYDFSEFVGAHANLFGPIVHFRRLGHVDFGAVSAPLLRSSSIVSSRQARSRLAWGWYGETVQATKTKVAFGIKSGLELRFHVQNSAKPPHLAGLATIRH